MTFCGIFIEFVEGSKKTKNKERPRQISAANYICCPHSLHALNMPKNLKNLI